MVTQAQSFHQSFGSGHSDPEYHDHVERPDRFSNAAMSRSYSLDSVHTPPHPMPAEYAVSSHTPFLPPPPQHMLHGQQPMGPVPIPVNPSSQPRKRTMRANQACTQCRLRKHKCDEGNPCTPCQESALRCTYHPSTPSRADKNMDKIMQYMQAHASGLQRMATQMGNVEARLQHMEELSKIFSAKLESEALAEDHDVVRPRAELDDHRTAPHKLMRYWPSIRPILQAAGLDYSDNYVRDLEDRGVLSLYTTGESDDHATRSSSRSRTPTSDIDAYGSPATFGEPQPVLSPVWGDLRADDSLHLDVETIDILYESYVKHIHIMHPFIDVRRLRRMVEDFIVTHGSGTRVAGTVPVDTQASHDPINPLKRKRHERPADSPAPTPPHPSFKNKAHERQAQHAVVYLVLALGKVCLHKHAISGARHDTPMENGVIQSSRVPTRKQSSASIMTEQISPAISFSSLKQGLQGHGSTPSTELPIRRPSVTSMMSVASANVHRLPGLAYYAKAAEILGEQGDGNDLIHAQMFLLAGLYKGQLVRVGESMSWITRASRVAMTLLERYKLYTNYWTAHGDIRKKLARGQARITSKNANLIVLVSWSCLQLESDILADIRLPSSGIQSIENSLLMPHNSREDDDGVYEQFPHHENRDDYDNILIYYTAQLFLRRKLNQIHREMYGSDCLSQSLDQVRGTLGSYELLLHSWRESLPDGYKWDDQEKPADNILAARLRAKYYGARYLVNRPFLDYALHIMPAIKDGRSVRDVARDVHGEPRHEADVHIFEAIQGMSESEIWRACRRCIEAAIQSTVAFDGVPEHDLIVTNIHGTAHAQFGNMLVLSAAYYSKNLNSLVPSDRFKGLLERTVAFLRRAAAISPTCRVDSEILEELHWRSFGVSHHA